MGPKTAFFIVVLSLVQYCGLVNAILPSGSLFSCGRSNSSGQAYFYNYSTETFNLVSSEAITLDDSVDEIGTAVDCSSAAVGPLDNLVYVTLQSNNGTNWLALFDTSTRTISSAIGEIDYYIVSAAFDLMGQLYGISSSGQIVQIDTTNPSQSQTFVSVPGNATDYAIGYASSGPSEGFYIFTNGTQDIYFFDPEGPSVSNYTTNATITLAGTFHLSSATFDEVEEDDIFILHGVSSDSGGAIVSFNMDTPEYSDPVYSTEENAQNLFIYYECILEGQCPEGQECDLETRTCITDSRDGGDDDSDTAQLIGIVVGSAGGAVLIFCLVFLLFCVILVIVVIVAVVFIVIIIVIAKLVVGSLGGGSPAHASNWYEASTTESDL